MLKKCYEYITKWYKLYFPKNNNAFGRLLYNETCAHPGTLFIVEDCHQIEAAFNEDEQFIRHQTVSLISHLLKLGVLMPIIGFIVSNLTVGSIVICSSVLLFFLVKPYTLYRRQKFVREYRILIQGISQQKSNIKRLFQLIEDSDNDELKCSFIKSTLKALLIYRNSTRLLVEQCPLKSCLKFELLCNLPEECLEFDETELTWKKLKSLRQFVRLQISEFLKLILFMFIDNYHDNTIFPLSVNFSPQDSICVINQELLSHLYLHKSLLVSFDNNNLLSKKNQQDVSLTTEEALLCSSIRNIRKSLYSSLQNIDDCEMLAEQFSTIDSEQRQHLREELECLLEHNQNVMVTISNAFKLIQVKGQTEGQQVSNGMTETETLNSNESNVHKNYDDQYVIKDEVYEAFVDHENDNDNNHTIATNGHDFESDLERMKALQSTENMFQELKSALKPKAIEFKAREEKALGREVDFEQIEREYEKQQAEESIRKAKRKAKYTTFDIENDHDDTFTENKHNNDAAWAFSNPMVFRLPNNELLNDNLRSMFLKNEETFGEQCSDSDN